MITSNNASLPLFCAWILSCLWYRDSLILQIHIIFDEQ